MFLALGLVEDTYLNNQSVFLGGKYPMFNMKIL